MEITPPSSADVLFDDELCAELRISRTTLKRLRRAGAFPIPTLPSLDKRSRTTRRALEAFKVRETRILLLSKRRTG
jgi:hypothetical protein